MSVCCCLWLKSVTDTSELSWLALNGCFGAPEQKRSEGKYVDIKGTTKLKQL